MASVTGNIKINDEMFKVFRRVDFVPKGFFLRLGSRFSGEFKEHYILGFRDS